MDDRKLKRGVTISLHDATKANLEYAARLGEMRSISDLVEHFGSLPVDIIVKFINDNKGYAVEAKMARMRHRRDLVEQ